MTHEIYIIDDDESSLPIFRELFKNDKDFFKEIEKLKIEWPKICYPINYTPTSVELHLEKFVEL